MKLNTSYSVSNWKKLRLTLLSLMTEEEIDSDKTKSSEVLKSKRNFSYCDCYVKTQHVSSNFSRSEFI